MDKHKQFIKAAAVKAFDKDHRKKLNYNIKQYDISVAAGKQQYSHLEHVRQYAKNIKWQALAQLDRYLLDFERNFSNRGGQVIWAETAEEALQSITKILQSKQAQKVVKAKSMTTEEIALNENLAALGIAVHETDLGEYIVQLAEEKPYHIVTPAIHKSKDDVADLFHKNLGTPLDSSAEALTQIAREHLREHYTTADVGITGANFLVADIGAIAITENEGNARLSTSYPKTHIAIVGIEKVIPSMQHLNEYWPLLSTFGTGQKVTVYNTLLLGASQAGEADGPEEMYVILLDNGRSKLLTDTEKRESLYCIRCGACLNACPIYKNIGGHAYGTTYTGPIGSVITPNFSTTKDYQHLSYASSSCGKCSEVCPVNIDIHNLLIANRRDMVDDGDTSISERLVWQIWKRSMLDRKTMNRGNATIKNIGFRWFMGNTWGKRRALPRLPKKSFNQLWQQKNGKK